MLTVIITIICVVIFWQLVAYGFRLGERTTNAAEMTAQFIALAAPQDVRDRYIAMQEAVAAKARRQKRERFWLGVVLAVIAVLYLASKAHAQGIYMGRDGRAHAQVIVGPDGRGWPVVPTFCTPGLGPCPVVLGAPLPPQFSPSYLEDGCEGDGNRSPECVPLGIVYTRGTVCPAPRTCPIVWVSVAADGLNVREPTTGQPLMALVNGTPLIVLERRGAWTLVARVCDLVPTGAWSVTANVPLNCIS